MTIPVPCPLPGDIAFCEPGGNGPFSLRIGTVAITLAAPGSDPGTEAEAMRRLMEASSTAAAALDRRAAARERETETS